MAASITGIGPTTAELAGPRHDLGGGNLGEGSEQGCQPDRRWHALPRVIVVWLDDPRDAAGALDVALTVGEVLGARTVVAGMATAGDPSPAAGLAAAVQVARERTGARLPSETLALTGRPNEQLRQLVASERADLVIVAAPSASPRRAGVTMRSVVGTVEATSIGCGVPVMVVPPGAPAVVDLTNARHRARETVGG